uniref:Nuclear transport factor 2 n=1 Tax=Ovis aries TaxID=9940 RepID=A0AC11EMP0_SHEEP
MGDKPIWEQIGSSFIQHYYQLFDNDRTQLGAIYIDASCLTWEGQQFQGKAAIVEKLSSLPFQKIQHSITAQDHQPTPDSCIISMVVGQLKVMMPLPRRAPSCASGTPRRARHSSHQPHRAIFKLHEVKRNKIKM